MANLQLQHPPVHRHEFEIAILCSLKATFNAVEAAFDEHWDTHVQYGKASVDTNTYSTGNLCGHNVVLACMPGKGKINSTTAGIHLRSSFSGIRLALVVGVCGASPKTAQYGQEVILGDVVISTGVIQFDFGRQLAGCLNVKTSLEDSLGRPNPEIRTFLAKLSSLEAGRALRNDTYKFLEQILCQSDFTQFRYPGADADKLFQPDYRHRHQNSSQCATCDRSTYQSDEVCREAHYSTCSELGCDDRMLIPRERLKDQHDTHGRPEIHIGRMACGDRVMQSTAHRDQLVREHKVVGFEMEGAGVWDTFPTLVIKGACSYADSHNSKDWQGFAAVAAVACTKAFLEQWPKVDRLPFPGRDSVNPEAKLFNSAHKLHRVLPLKTANHYTERPELLAEIEHKLHTAQPRRNPPHTIAITGLGGSGKTQLALRYVEKNQHLYQGIFWIRAESEESAFRSFEMIAEELGLPPAGPDQSGSRIHDSALVRQVLRNLRNAISYNWLVVIDNADSPEWGLREIIPKASNGSIIVTSVLDDAGKLFERESDAVRVHKMSRTEAVTLLLAGGEDSSTRRSHDMLLAEQIVEELDFLALAIDLARGFLEAQPRLTLHRYLALITTNRDEMLSTGAIKGLDPYGKDVANVWNASLAAVEKSNPDSVLLLQLLSFMSPDAIQDEIFRRASLGILKPELGARETKIIQSTIPPTSSSSLRSAYHAISNLVKGKSTRDKLTRGPAQVIKSTASDPRIATTPKSRLSRWLECHMLSSNQGVWDDLKYQKAMTVLRSYNLVQPLQGKWAGVSMNRLVQWRARSIAKDDQELKDWAMKIAVAAALQSLSETPDFRPCMISHVNSIASFVPIHEPEFVRIVSQIYRDEYPGEVATTGAEEFERKLS